MKDGNSSAAPGAVQVAVQVLAALPAIMERGVDLWAAVRKVQREDEIARAGRCIGYLRDLKELGGAELLAKVVLAEANARANRALGQ